MSEFASSYMDNQRYQEAYAEAAQRAQGLSDLQASKLRDYEEQKQALDSKYEKVSATLEAVGLAPLHHGLENLIDAAKERASKKVSAAATDLEDRIRNRVGQTADNLQEQARDAINKVTTRVKNAVDNNAQSFKNVVGDVDQATQRAISTANVAQADAEKVAKRTRGVRKVVNGRNPRNQVANRGATDEELSQRMARNRQRLQQLKNRQVDVNPDSLTGKGAVSEEDLARTRALTTGAKQQPINLTRDEGTQDLDFRDMAKNSWRLDADSSIRSTNPYSPYNNADFKEGVEDFKEYSSLREQRLAQRVAQNKARLEALKNNTTPDVKSVDSAPAKANDIAPQKLYGRGLDRGNVKPDAGDFKPSVGQYENQKVDAAADLKQSGLTIRPSDVKSSNLSSVSDIAQNEEAAKQVEARQADENQAREEAQAQAQQNVIDHNQPQGAGNQSDFVGGNGQPKNDISTRPRDGSDATQDSGDNDVNQPVKTEPTAPDGATEGEGEDVGETIAKGLATSAETDVELGGPADILGDAISAAVGLGSILGGIFGGSHDNPHVPEIQAPKINPAQSYGI